MATHSGKAKDAVSSEASRGSCTKGRRGLPPDAGRAAGTPRGRALPRGTECSELPAAWPCSAPRPHGWLSALPNHPRCPSACPIGCQRQRQRDRERHTQRNSTDRWPGWVVGGGGDEGEGGRGKGVRVPGLGAGVPLRTLQSQEGWKHRPMCACASGFGRSGGDGASGVSVGALGDDDLPDPTEAPGRNLNARTTTVLDLIFANQQVTSCAVTA